MHYVIGSGPSGVIASSALLARGVEVTMLDVGDVCDPATLAKVKELSEQDPENWKNAAVRKISGGLHLDAHGIPSRLLFNSDYVYSTDALRTVKQEHTNCAVSFAQGGLSNIWGGAMLPARAEDLAEWPVTLQDMTPHYAAVAKTVRIAGTSDDLESMYPFYTDPIKPAAVSRQASWILGKMSAHRNSLRKNGFLFGNSRLAIRTEPDGMGAVCQNVGLCLTGCPFFAIYSSTQTLEQLKKNKNFSYSPGWRVMKVVEVNDLVEIECAATDGSRKTFKGKRVFLACGPISTTQIMLNSLKKIPDELPLRYQPYFLLPVLLQKNFANVSKERLHTLSQLFVEISDAAISQYPVHLQFYTYNNLIRERLSIALRHAPFLIGLAEKVLLGRLALIQGYMHSNDASPIRVRVQRDATTSEPRVRLWAPKKLEARRAIHKVVRKLLMNSRRLGFFPMLPMLDVGMPGHGNHIGAIFPMKNEPGEFESDIYGRVAGLKRIHMVDSSVLTTIPAATITYTIMANAHRIASTTNLD